MSSKRRAQKSGSEQPEPDPKRARSHQRLMSGFLVHARDLLGAATSHELFSKALGMGSTLLGFDSCRLAVLGPGNDCTLLTSGKPGELEREVCPANVGLVGRALSASEMVRLSASEVKRHAHPQFDAALVFESMRCAVLLPLRTPSAGVVGVFIGATRSKHYDGSENLAHLESFALNLGAALELTRARHDLRHWNAIVQSSDAAILGKDTRGIITHWNPAAERLYGYSAAEAIGRSIEIIVPPEKRAELAELMDRIARGEPIEPLQTVRMNQAGERLTVSLTLSSIKDPEGRVVGVSAIARDITASVLASAAAIAERRRAQSERERLLREAENAVLERDQFLSIASHELRTPLTTLRLTTHALHLGTAAGDANHAARLRKKLLAVERQVERLDKLVEQLLDLSRISSGRFELELSETDLSHIVREVVERFAQSEESSANAIRLDAAPPVAGRWDASRLDQVFTNLIANALRYGQGKPVEVSVVRRLTTAEVSVRDHGCGIAPEHLSKIFERFTRADSQASRAGFGLGLWIVREIVEAHGGRITVRSQPGAGSTFTVSLPRPPS